MVFRNGALFLFKAFGIRVFVDWMWFLVAAFFVQRMAPMFHNDWWALVTYVGFFGIVLLHEYGHALACRSVGGTAKRIILWPLGGIAYVNPPPRPGAVLWCIVAGPLVNVVLIPVTAAAYLIVVGSTPTNEFSDLQTTVAMLTVINVTVLAFNLLPIYPLDGGRILESVLWMVIGRAQALRVAAITGMVFGVLGGLAALAGVFSNVWIIVIAVFVVIQAWNGYKIANQMIAHERMLNPWQRKHITRHRV